MRVERAVSTNRWRWTALFYFPPIRCPFLLRRTTLLSTMIMETHTIRVTHRLKHSHAVKVGWSRIFVFTHRMCLCVANLMSRSFLYDGLFAHHQIYQMSIIRFCQMCTLVYYLLSSLLLRQLLPSPWNIQWYS